MTREEVKSMDFEAFKAALPTMEDVHYLEADGTEVYGIYKHDVCATWKRTAYSALCR